MYKVLIVEDELNVCRGLTVLVDWEMLGFTVAGFCRDGLSAQRQLEMEHYDLVLCDIHIPGLNGLELIQWIRSKKMSTEIIVISAYAQFEYAQRAIDNHVVTYLLKPIDESLLENALRRVKNMLDNPREARTASVSDSMDVVGSAVREIHSSYGKNLTTESLARSLYISSVRLNQLFREKYDMSVKEYINDVRLERAKFLLERTDSKIYEIAGDVGFSDIDYFTTLFKKKNGVTPTVYRRMVNGEH